MKLLRSALLGILAVAAILVAYAATSNDSPLGNATLPTIELASPIGGAGGGDATEVDQLRALCRIEWPASDAGRDAESVRRKACRGFGS